MTGNSPRITPYTTPQVIATGPVWHQITLNQVATTGDGHWREFVGYHPDGSDYWIDVEPPVRKGFWYWNGSSYIGCYMSAAGDDISQFLTEESKQARRGPRALLEGHPVLIYPRPVLPPVVGPPGHWYESGWMYVWIFFGLIYNIGGGIFGWSQRDPARNDQWILWFVPETFLFGWVPFVGAIIAAVRHVKPHSAVARWGYGLLAGAAVAKVAVDHQQARQIRHQQEQDYQAASRQSAEEYRAKWQQAQTSQPPPPPVYNASGAEIPSPGRGLPQ